MIKKFFAWNVRISRYIDSKLYSNSSRDLLDHFVEKFDPSDRVADVGGGKKPVLGVLRDGNFPVSQYDGFDIDIEELEQARTLYSNVHVVDLTESLRDEHRNKYSKILCKSTLEHVTDDATAFNNLVDMLEDGGELYIKAPCKSAIFARLNRILPNEFKRRMLHFIFPEKVGDGFPAYYKGCSIPEMKQKAARHNMTLQASNKHMASSYFMFFVPLYFLWRLITVPQILFNKNHCENFEIVFKKQHAGAG